MYGEAQKPSAFKEVLEEEEVLRSMKRIDSSICSWPSVDLRVILGKLLGGAWPWELPSVLVQTEPICSVASHDPA